MKRLQKVISESGYTSRRKAEELIQAGTVYVNGECIKELGYKVDGEAEIEIDGTILKREEKVYILLNKPSGVISAVTDNRGRKTVVDIVDSEKRVYPVGRLDYDTTGLLLLTNDGELSNLLTHPSGSIPKTYIAKVRGFVNKSELTKLEKGVMLNGVKTKRCKAKTFKYNKKSDICYVKITITEGRNHQVKDMFKAINHDVLKLKRESEAFLTLDGLKSGEYRYLSTKEVKKLYNEALNGR